MLKELSRNQVVKFLNSFGDMGDYYNLQVATLMSLNLVFYQDTETEDLIIQNRDTGREVFRIAKNKK